jgi:hypothetical protein
MNNMINHKEFEEFIKNKFTSENIYNELFRVYTITLKGISLKSHFYNFNFNEPYTEIQEFLIDKCTKLPTGRVNKSIVYQTFTKWKQLKEPNYKISKNDENKIYAFLNKYFFHDLFYTGKTCYLGWFGISIKGDEESGASLTAKHKRLAVYKIDKDTSNILEKWESQKKAGEKLGKTAGTIKNWIDNKVLINESYYIVNGNKDLIKK